MSWTAERDRLLVTGFEDGHSARIVAEHLGVTRNAVLGRKNRLGLSKPTGARRQHGVDGLVALGRAARACNFTVAELEELRKDFEECKL